MECYFKNEEKKSTMNQIFNITISGIGDIPVSADSWEEAEEIVQAYIDKRSLDWVINYG